MATTNASRAERPVASSLYERDPYAWSIEQAGLLRDGRLGEIDNINVADEILSVGKQQLFALEESLIELLTDMLIWETHEDRRSHRCNNSILGHRHEVTERLRANPSLSAHVDEALQWSFGIARLRASSETDADLAFYPETCPYDWDAIMTRPFERDPGDPE